MITDQIKILNGAFSGEGEDDPVATDSRLRFKLKSYRYINDNT